MAKKRSHPVEAPKPRPVQTEEPVEVRVVIPRNVFPERFKVHTHVNGQQTENSYSRDQMERLYEEACALSKTSGLANCHTWMQDLKIDYAAAVWIMDIMEHRGRVKPIVYKDGVAESSGPRQFTASS
jgi:hypothetical protein